MNIAPWNELRIVHYKNKVIRKKIGRGHGTQLKVKVKVKVETIAKKGISITTEFTAEAFSLSE